MIRRLRKLWRDLGDADPLLRPSGPPRIETLEAQRARDRRNGYARGFALGLLMGFVTGGFLVWAACALGGW